MKNKEVAAMLYEIADVLEIRDEEFKPRAYRRAARSIESLSDPIEDVYARGELEEIDGVGSSIAGKVAEYLDTGTMTYYEELKKDLPVDIEALTRVEGIGPKTAQTLYAALGITSLDELEAAAEAGRIADVEGFGEKTQENILRHIGMAKAGMERMLLGDVFPIAANLEERLAASEYFDRVAVVGSFRRRRSTVGDLDVLATSPDPEQAMDVFCGHEDVQEVLGKGSTKSSIIVSGGLHVDLRIVEPGSYGAALMYFTGSKDHNVELRRLAIDKGWKLNEYGLFDGEDRLAGETEEAVYDRLGLAYIPPELRENTGEIAAAEAGELPELVAVEDVRGDLQLHTTYSDGSASVKEMAAAAQERGYEYVLVTDHGPGMEFVGGLDMADVAAQRKEVRAVNEELDITVLHGLEANISADGLDVSVEQCREFDLVVASLHDRVADATDAVVQVLEEYPVHIWGHPLNRLLNRREAVELELDWVMAVAAEQQVAVEINAQPERLDLPWDLVKQYRDTVSFVVSTDAHAVSELGFMDLGVAQARRGWCTREDVLNTRSLDGFRSFFQ